MAVTTSFLSSATNERYDAQALTYVGSTIQRQYIEVTALALGISPAAIAGAMAEENTAYLQNKTINDGLDDYALGRLPTQTPWTHEQWLTDYNLVGGDTGAIASEADKLRNPVLIDMGQANFKMTTAIRLVYSNRGQTTNISVTLPASPFLGSLPCRGAHALPLPVSPGTSSSAATIARSASSAKTTTCSTCIT